MRLLFLVAGLLLVTPQAPRSPVRLLVGPGYRCSAVVITPDAALTAAHCTHGAGVRLGTDLAMVFGKFPPPYAKIGRRPPLGASVLLEGYGCDPERVWFVDRPVLSVRPARLVARMPGAGGVELVLLGRVCGGDSGGAIWSDHGNLIGIMTARDTRAPDGLVLGFGTPVE